MPKHLCIQLQEHYLDHRLRLVGHDNSHACMLAAVDDLLMHIDSLVVLTALIGSRSLSLCL